MEKRVTAWRFADLAVIGGGLLSSASVLLLVYWIGRQDRDFAIMGWYALFIIPVGAALAGIGAGCGYGLMSWRTGRKITGALLAVIVLLLASAYGAAQWIEFRSLHLVDAVGNPVDFFTYFDVTTRSMTFQSSHSKTPSGSLGMLGYLFRLLELVGFSLGGLIIPIAFRAKPYCEPCQTYMRRRARWWLPAAVPARKVPRKDPKESSALEREMEAAHKKATDLLNTLVAAAKGCDATAFRSVLEQNGVGAKEASKLLKSINLAMHSCPQCQNGVIEMEFRAGLADRTKITPLGREPVSAGFIAALGDVRPRQGVKLG